MKGIIFGSLHSYDDLRLILESKEMGAPDVKVNKIDIPGADSALDLTDFFGEPKYEDVKHKFQFTSIEPQETFPSQFSQIKNAIHGKKVRIILDDDPSFFYMGRCFVSSFTNAKGIGTVSVECECEPFKYHMQETVVSATLDGTSQNMYDNSKITIVSSAIKLLDDGFMEIDLNNISGAWQYVTFFHQKHEAGEIAPNQNVTIVLESKDVTVSGDTVTSLYFTTNNETQPDYFSPATYSTRIETHARKTAALYPAAIKDATTISAAVYFIRSFFAVANGSKIKGKFRVSILPGDVKAGGFVYTSYDGQIRGLQLANSKKRVIPTITASSAFTLYFEGNSYTVSAGQTVIPEIELKEGINDIAVKALAQFPLHTAKAVCEVVACIRYIATASCSMTTALMDCVSTMTTLIWNLAKPGCLNLRFIQIIRTLMKCRS